jgi:hypothetical protein
MVAADQRQEHGAAQSAHEVVPLGIYTPSPGPVNIEEPIPINVKKRERIVRGDVKHVGQRAIGAIVPGADKGRTMKPDVWLPIAWSRYLHVENPPSPFSTGQRNQVFSPKELLWPMRRLPDEAHFA